MVTTAQVRVEGITLPDAVVSVNGDLITVDERGNFSTQVALAEGPNVIDVVASDFSGNEVSKSLAIIYLP